MSEWPELDKALMHVSLLHSGNSYRNKHFVIDSVADGYALSIYIANVNPLIRHTIPVYASGVFLRRGKWQENIIEYLERVADLLEERLRLAVVTPVEDVEIPKPTVDIHNLTEEEFLEISIKYPGIISLAKMNNLETKLELIPIQSPDERYHALNLDSGTYGVILSRVGVYGVDAETGSPTPLNVSVVESILQGYV